MKKIILFILCIILSSSCYAKEKIYCELENRDSVTFFSQHLSNPIFKSFVKLVDKNNDEQYWFRISNNSSNRFLYYMDIVLDNQTYRLYEIQNPNFHHIKSTTSYPPANTLISYSIYEIPKDIINKIKTSKTPIEFIVNRQKKQGIKCSSNIEFYNSIKKIISLTYSDKDTYWKPNIQQ